MLHRNMRGNNRVRELNKKSTFTSCHVPAFTKGGVCLKEKGVNKGGTRRLKRKERKEKEKEKKRKEKKKKKKKPE